MKRVTVWSCVFGMSLAGSLLGQDRTPVKPVPEPPSRGGYRGPSDVVAPGTGQPGPQPIGPAPWSPPTARPAPAPRPQHLRQVPDHIARALQRYGTPLNLEHERTAKSRLTYAWESVCVMPPAAEGPTVAVVKAKALPFAEAVALLVDGDLRPLLVLRESWPLGGSESVEMDRKLQNEKTLLLAKWFRCVQVTDSVQHKDHPLHSLFASTPAPRLVLCSPDGSHLSAWHGDETLSRLWAEMLELLGRHVDGDCAGSVQELLGVLSRYDHIDSMETELSTRLDRLLDTPTTLTREIDALRARLADLARERVAVEALERRLLELPLKRRKAGRS